MVEDRYTLLIWEKANRPRGGTERQHLPTYLTSPTSEYFEPLVILPLHSPYLVHTAF